MSYLAKFEHGAPEVEELKQWLRGFITRPDYLTNPSRPPLAHLRTALTLACKEISQILDLQLETLIRVAKQRDSCIEVPENDFWESRTIDFDGILENKGKDLREEDDVVACLEAARDEIEWMRNEMRRLDVHVDNARDAIREGWRRSFVYRPTPRKGGGGVSAAREIDDDDEEVKGKLVEFLKAREERSQSPVREMGPGSVDVGMEEVRMRRSATPERRLADVDADVEEGEVKCEEERRDSGGGGGAAK
ncbi:hypothetical protein AC578_6770 [Pseudocercospora eumusae]|uniref:Uncharacterized protein n=1 Tax=Pseudocercospora eumusae TaxID=321146 RepID=A0A139GYX4_9PEZI|nr:hypothetical protein AC578_6770 [Pseudocercospora eumusae]